MNRRIKIAVLGIALLAVVAVPLGTHYRAKARVREYRLKLMADGEKLTVEELAPKPSPDEIAAGRDLVFAASFLFSNYSNAPMMRFVAPGRALAASREPVLPTEDATNVWPGLELLLAANENGVAQIRAALAAAGHGFAFNLDYGAGPSVALPHLPRLKSVAQWLSLAAMVDLHQGDLTNACENLDALAVSVAEHKNDALLISQLVRIAMGAIAISATWEALQSPGWHDDQLQRLQARWETMDFVGQAASALAMERVFSERAFALGRRSYNGIRLLGSSGNSGLSELAQMGKDVVDNPAQGIREFLNRYPGYWGWKYWQSYTDELANAQALQAALEALRLVQQRRPFGVAMRDFEERLQQVRGKYPSVGKYLGYSIADTIDRYLMRIRWLEMQRSLLVCALALQRCQLKHGSFPDTLDALAPEFLQRPPLDPIDGKPLRYRLNPDGTFALYSIGENGVDDGGRATQFPETPRQWWRARDALWPLPATPEQVRAEFRKIGDAFKEREAGRAGQGIDPRVMEQFRRRYGLPPAPSPQTN